MQELGIPAASRRSLSAAGSSTSSGVTSWSWIRSRKIGPHLPIAEA